jgi:gliding motility-associated-like protein
MRVYIFFFWIFLSISLRAQPVYNVCSEALELCPNQAYTLTNIGANKTFCGGCEDDFTFCFAPINTVWFTFTTNASGGDVQLDFTNLVFELNPNQGTAVHATILSAGVACNSASYTAIGNCVSNASAAFSLNAMSLPANTTYYVVLSGAQNGIGVTQAAECTFNLNVSGSGIMRPAATVSLLPSATTLCKNEIFTATAVLTNCPDTTNFSWYVNGVFVAQTTVPYFQTTALNDLDTVSVQTSCYSLCTEIVSALTPPISIYSFPIDAGLDQVISLGETVQLNGFTSAPVFAWSPPLGLQNPQSLSTFATPTVSTLYTLTATENGCTASDHVLVSISETLIFPTTFSPNDDGINDKWEIEGIADFPNCFVRIYSRWGQEVFQATGYSAIKAWDGTGDSGKLPAGVYFYIVELRDLEKREYRGSITLIR